MNGGLAVEFATFGLLLVGYCDAATAPRLDGALRRWDRARRRYEVDATLVTFADSHGLVPVAEFVRRCRQMRYPDPRVIPGDAVPRVLAALGVDHVPFGLRARDAAAAADRGVLAY